MNSGTIRRVAVSVRIGPTPKDKTTIEMAKIRALGAYVTKFGTVENPQKRGRGEQNRDGACRCRREPGTRHEPSDAHHARPAAFGELPGGLGQAEASPGVDHHVGGPDHQSLRRFEAPERRRAQHGPGHDQIELAAPQLAARSLANHRLVGQRDQRNAPPPLMDGRTENCRSP